MLETAEIAVTLGGVLKARGGERGKCEKLDLFYKIYTCKGNALLVDMTYLLGKLSPHSNDVLLDFNYSRS